MYTTISGWGFNGYRPPSHFELFLIDFTHTHTHTHTQATRPFSLSPTLGADEEGAPHFRRSSVTHPLAGKISSLPKELRVGLEGESPYTMPHPIWSKEELEGVEITHSPPKTWVDKVSDFYLLIGGSLGPSERWL